MLQVASPPILTWSNGKKIYAANLKKCFQIMVWKGYPVVFHKVLTCSISSSPCNCEKAAHGAVALWGKWPSSPARRYQVLGMILWWKIRIHEYHEMDSFCFCSCAKCQAQLSIISIVWIRALLKFPRRAPQPVTLHQEIVAPSGW